MRYIELKEVNKHTSENDCWIIANGYVYDVSKYMNIHPGSTNAILKHAGQDVSYDYNFHSLKAKKIWKKLIIGYVKKQNNSCCIIS